MTEREQQVLTTTYEAVGGLPSTEKLEIRKGSVTGHLLAGHASGEFIFGYLQRRLRRQSGKKVEGTCNDARPARLMAGSQTRSIVSVEILVKQDVVF